jgi:TRAP-type mannitol/chloroaromatic compound transport system substrate-binding protein
VLEHARDPVHGRVPNQGARSAWDVALRLLDGVSFSSFRGSVDEVLDWLFHGSGLDVVNRELSFHNVFAYPISIEHDALGLWCSRLVSSIQDLAAAQWHLQVPDDPVAKSFGGRVRGLESFVDMGETSEFSSVVYACGIADELSRSMHDAGWVCYTDTWNQGAKLSWVVMDLRSIRDLANFEKLALERALKAELLDSMLTSARSVRQQLMSYAEHHLHLERMPRVVMDHAYSAYCAWLHRTDAENESIRRILVHLQFQSRERGEYHPEVEYNAGYLRSTAYV